MESQGQPDPEQDADTLLLAEEQLADLEGARIGRAVLAAPSGRFLAVNDALCRLTGASREELLSPLATDVARPEGRIAAMLGLDRLLPGDTERSTTTVHYRRPDGTARWLRVDARLLGDAAGRPGRASCVVQDVTATVRIQEELRLSEARSRSLAEALPAIMWSARPDGAVDFYNRRWAEYSGCADWGERGWGFQPVFHPDDLAATIAAWREALRSGEAYEIEHRIRRHDGVHRWFLSRALPLRDVGGRLVGWVGAALDIEARKRAEEERRSVEARLRDADKVESLAVLAGGVAHDLNNLLVGIMGYAELALESKSPAELGEHIGEVRAAAERAKALARKMLAFSGRSRFVVAPADLSELVRGHADELRRLVPTGELALDLAPDLPPVSADAGQIRQLLNELVMNAGESLGPPPGSVIVRTARLAPDSALLAQAREVVEFPEGAWVVIAVEDTGCGMDAATRARAFEPFFSTKFPGRGLGLSAVQGIARGHHGAVLVDSTPGGGARVSVLLPCLGGPRAALVREAACTLPPSELTTLLVVDDDRQVLAVTRRLLERSGFRVLTATNGQEAIEALERHADEVRLVMLDVVMPVMDGPTAAVEIRRRDPTLPIMFASGFADSMPEVDLPGPGPVAFLAKPFERRQLSARILELVGAPRGT